MGISKSPGRGYGRGIFCYLFDLSDNSFETFRVVLGKGSENFFRVRPCLTRSVDAIAPEEGEKPCLDRVAYVN